MRPACSRARLRKVEALFPALRTLRRQRAAEAAIAARAAAATVQPDDTLVQLCTEIRRDQRAADVLGTVAPQQWEAFSRQTEPLLALVDHVAATPARTRTGLRAKALALHALLDEGEGSGLGPDAAAPDLLAWSLVQDILAE
jgi:hypothetical protein